MDREALVEQMIQLALAEDLSTEGDITSRAIFADSDRATAIIKAKEAGILSGVSLIEPIFAAIDTRIEITLKASDGQPVITGTPICELKGPIIGILSGERLTLNLLQHLSGVASATAQLVSLISHTNAQLLDTRKTTPNLRFLEKEAVAHGGGTNHRFGLYDMIMAKDTHVLAAGGPDKAVLKAQSWSTQNGNRVKIEVEVENLSQFDKALATAPTRIMLDNMSCDDMRTAVATRDEKNPSVELEASGNVSAATIASIAETGVDYISVGAITHSVPALDIHLKIIEA